MKRFHSLLIGVMCLGLASGSGVGASSGPQMNRRVFTAFDGAPGSVSALAQTTDGTLWVGGHAGLRRFDGVRFVDYPEAGDDPLPSTNISSLTASPDGGLWIGYRLGGVTFLKNGRTVNYSEKEGFPSGSTLGFARDREGVLWALTSWSLARLKGARWERDADVPSFPGAMAGFLIDRKGSHWIAHSDALLVRPVGEKHFQEVLRTAFDPFRMPLAESPRGHVWAASKQGLIRADSGGQTRLFAVPGSSGRSARPIAFDGEGNLWAANDGVLRAGARDLGTSDTLDVQRYAPSDGPRRLEVTAIIQDREGNIWVGTNSGLVRLSLTNVVRHFAGCESWAVAPGDSGSLWIACPNERATLEVRDGVVIARHETPFFSSIHRDVTGQMWFAGPRVLAHLENGKFILQPLPPAAGSGDAVQALIRDQAGDVWISSLRGVFRLHDGVWTPFGGVDGLPRRGALAMRVAPDALWFGYRDGRVARLKDRLVTVFDGLEVGIVQTIHADGTDVFVGGELGLARLDGGRFVPIKDVRGAPLPGVSGIVRSSSGDIWLNTIAGVSRIAERDLQEGMLDPAHRVRTETFNHLDGIPGAAPQLRPAPSAIQATDGRIWFVTTAGVVSIDEHRHVHNPLPPPVTIWAIIGDGQRYGNGGSNIELPMNTERLQIEYTAGSLTVPERVRFRYRLEGVDRTWHDAGDRREATYANLGPGQYRFHVTASNNDGVWNETGESVTFAIAPAYYQTRWFYALCGLAFIALLFGLYRLRVEHVSARIRGQLEARLAERERIARELHDTLLQGVQGLIWRFQAASDRIPPGEPARELMEKSLDRADDLLAESREKVKHLRLDPTDARTLEQALAAEGIHFAELAPTQFRVSVEGALRELHPLAQEEAHLIGREAICNAFQHARAHEIEVEITYGEGALRVRVRDDGSGIVSSVMVEGGKPGHYGLIGMRERARQLGADLEVWSKPGAGTEVELRIPATVAYPIGRRGAGASSRWATSFRSVTSPDCIDEDGTSR